MKLWLNFQVNILKIFTKKSCYEKNVFKNAIVIEKMFEALKQELEILSKNCFFFLNGNGKNNFFFYSGFTPSILPRGSGSYVDEVLRSRICWVKILQ